MGRDGSGEARVKGSECQSFCTPGLHGAVQPGTADLEMLTILASF